VAALHLDGRGAHALGEETFKVEVDGAVVFGNDGPARLRLPCGAVNHNRTAILVSTRFAFEQLIPNQLSGKSREGLGVGRACDEILSYPTMRARPALRFPVRRGPWSLPSRGPQW
jgi:hypothetical protein